MKEIEFIEHRYGNYIPGDIERIKQIVKLVGTNEKILDIGCGIGIVGSQIIKKNNIVYGIDLSKKAVAMSKKRGLKARVHDLRKKFPFKKNFFDGIIMGEIIEHIIDTDEFLQKIKMYLKKDGYIIITTPNLASLGRRLLLLFGKNPHIEYYLRKDSAGHVRYFIKETLFQLLKENGFEVEKFVSDEINLNAAGTIKLKFITCIWPTLGRTLIVKARRIK